MKLNDSMHTDLIAAQKLVYEPSGFALTNLKQEAESQEYGACTFALNGKIIHFRVAKITPTKVGQFVTFWKRIGTGPIMPYDISDQFDFLVVSVRKAGSFGQFVFPKNVLLQKGLLSGNGNNGKRAMRVYPPWDLTDNAQAKRTQTWQRLYFFEIKQAAGSDAAHLQKLFR